MKNIFKINNLSHLGDLIAIPFFFLLTYYFYNLKEKSILEYILFYFSLGGLIADIFYTYIYFR